MDSKNRARVRAFPKRRDGVKTHSCMAGSARDISVGERHISSFYAIVAEHMWSLPGETDAKQGCYLSEIRASSHQLVVDLDFKFESEVPESFQDGPALEEIVCSVCDSIFSAYGDVGDVLVTSTAPTPLHRGYKAGIHIFFPSISVDRNAYAKAMSNLRACISRTPLQLLCGDGLILANSIQDIVDEGITSLRLYCAKKYARRCKRGEVGHTQCRGKCALDASARAERFRRYAFVSVFQYLGGGSLERTEKHQEMFERADQHDIMDATLDARVQVLTLLTLRPTQVLQPTPFAEAFLLAESERAADPARGAPREPGPAPAQGGGDEMEQLDPEDPVYIAVDNILGALLGKQAGVTEVTRSRLLLRANLRRNVCLNHPIHEDGSIHEHSSNGSYVVLTPDGFASFLNHDEECKAFRYPIQIQNRKSIELIFGKPPQTPRAVCLYKSNSLVSDTLMTGAQSVRAYIDKSRMKCVKIRTVLREAFS